jgi:hypothetical protein
MRGKVKQQKKYKYRVPLGTQFLLASENNGFIGRLAAENGLVVGEISSFDVTLFALAGRIAFFFSPPFYFFQLTIG